MGSKEKQKTEKKDLLWEKMLILLVCCSVCCRNLLLSLWFFWGKTGEVEGERWLSFSREKKGKNEWGSEVSEKNMQQRFIIFLCIHIYIYIALLSIHLFHHNHNNNNKKPKMMKKKKKNWNPSLFFLVSEFVYTNEGRGIKLKWVCFFFFNSEIQLCLSPIIKTKSCKRRRENGEV